MMYAITHTGIPRKTDTLFTPGGGSTGGGVQGNVKYKPCITHTGIPRKTDTLYTPGGGGAGGGGVQGNVKYKTHMCRDLAQRGKCPRGVNCTFAHSQEEMER